ncbi:hydroquinone glucosyltransferase-like [Silene latifolia]|uniref:hydroquinone glucosyltransferase-like n=1 Tax=Silene latifolia TaxID=37657 RepID=UPI003D76BBF3
MEEQKIKQSHIAIVPTPGLGHLIPFIEFAKLLITRFDLSVTLLLQTRSIDIPSQQESSLLSSLPNTISYHFLPPVDLTHLPLDVSHDVTLSLIPLHSVLPIREVLSSLTTRFNLLALVTDLFGSAFFDVAKEIGIPPYIYFTTNATYLLFLLNLPRLDEIMVGEFRDMDGPVVLPGCMVEFYVEDIEDSLQDRKGEAYAWNLHHVKKYALTEGIFVNSFRSLEPDAFMGLRNGDPSWPPVYPIGPVVRSSLDRDGKEPAGSECLRWLDQQPSKSVIYVSFGSGGTLSREQINELAIGLEKSGHGFLWVVRNPDDESSFGSYFGVQGEDDFFGFLPSGFVDRTKERGLLVRSWAPQVKVLGHESIGGFLTHCGWNSVLESLVHGVPMIAWPLYAEQKTNAAMLDRGLKVALRVETNEKGIVEADNTAKVVKDLLDGEEGTQIATCLAEFRSRARSSVDECGDSTKSLDEVVLKLMSSINA